jgi:hypothetical protein
MSVEGANRSMTGIKKLIDWCAVSVRNHWQISSEEPGDYLSGNDDQKRRKMLTAPHNAIGNHNEKCNPY